MSINNQEFAEKFTGELDKILIDESAVGFMNDNAFKAKFVGAKTVKIPSISMQGLGDYDRDTGFIKGSVNVSNTAYTMKQDRARTFSIDREDMDETGVAELAGSVMSEFVRTKVIPETDAYTLSKLAGLAATRGQLIATPNAAKPYAMFNELLDQIQTEVGMDEELVCFIDRYMWNQLRKSDEFTRTVDIANFKQGEISFEVNKIDNVSIIPVSGSRMQTAYTFLSGKDSDEAGGFMTSENARGIYMLMLPKKAASLVKKSEKIRVFTPGQNLNADAYKFDYRLYYDVFVKNSYVSSVWAALAPSVTIITNLNKTVTKTAGSISGSLVLTGTASDSSELKFQWYSCSDADKTNAVRIVGATTAAFKVSQDIAPGKYFYFLRITAGGSTIVDSNVCELIIQESAE